MVELYGKLSHERERNERLREECQISSARIQQLEAQLDRQEALHLRTIQGYEQYHHSMTRDLVLCGADQPQQARSEREQQLTAANGALRAENESLHNSVAQTNKNSKNKQNRVDFVLEAT